MRFQGQSLFSKKESNSGIDDLCPSLSLLRHFLIIFVCSVLYTFVSNGPQSRAWGMLCNWPRLPPIFAGCFLDAASTVQPSTVCKQLCFTSKANVAAVRAKNFQEEKAVARHTPSMVTHATLIFVKITLRGHFPPINPQLLKNANKCLNSEISPLMTSAT